MTKFGKLALIVSAVLGSGAAGATTVGDITNTGGSDLFLVVFDSADGQAYVRDLGVSSTQALSPTTALNGFGTGSQFAPPYQAVAPTTNITSKLNVGPDATLTAFLGLAGHATDTWAIFAGSQDTTTTAGKTTNVEFTTSTGDLSATLGAAAGNAATINTNLGTLQNAFGGLVASTLGLGATSGNASAASSALYAGLTSPDMRSWAGNGAGAGSVQYAADIGLNGSSGLYGLAAYGTSTSKFESVSNIGTVSLSSSGALSFSPVGGSTVPVPAAGWLFGSSLLGLVGVARRRRVAA
jgi:hypothetical protein